MRCLHIEQKKANILPYQTTHYSPHEPTGPCTIVNRLSRLSRRKRSRTALSRVPLSILRKHIAAAPPSPAVRCRGRHTCPIARHRCILRLMALTPNFSSGDVVPEPPEDVPPRTTLAAPAVDVQSAIAVANRPDSEFVLFCVGSVAVDMDTHEWTRDGMGRRQCGRRARRGQLVSHVDVLRVLTRPTILSSKPSTPLVIVGAIWRIYAVGFMFVT